MPNRIITAYQKEFLIFLLNRKNMHEETSEEIFGLTTVKKAATPVQKSEPVISAGKFFKVLNKGSNSEQIMGAYALGALKKMHLEAKNDFSEFYTVLYECTESGERVE